jgi:[acyl-carrier-protein] S-malonyltransferase
VTTALLCPGQGSQTPGMGEGFYRASGVFRDRFDALADVADERGVTDDLRRLCFDADAETLARTRYTQPAVYAVSTAAARTVAERTDLAVDIVAGHSLGHYTALVAAGMCAVEDGLKLVAKRGTAMERAGTGVSGRMVAVFLADPESVTDVCAPLRSVAVAGYNTDRQTVVSGPADGVETALSRIRERADRVRSRDLPVGTAFHSPLMTPATGAVTDALQGTRLQPAERPVVSDVTGEPYTDPGVARLDLAEQVVSPVRWTDVVATLRERGVDRYVELPPAGTLSQFVERLHPEATVVSLETPGDLTSLADQ